MDFFNAFIGGAQIFTAGLALENARGNAELAIKASELEQMQLRHRSDMAKIQAKDLIAQADTDVQRRQQQVKQMIGSQKASLAGQGVIIEGELGQKLEQQEKKILREDSAAIKNNAWRQAFGLELRAQDFQNKAAYSAIEARGRSGRILSEGFSDASDLLISGGSKLLKQYKGKKIPTSKPADSAINMRGPVSGVPTFVS